MRCRCPEARGNGGTCVLAVPDGPPEIVRHNNSFPQYAYGLLLAAVQAHNLRVPEITAIELGVAGGNGLVELERLAADIGAWAGVRIRVAGFDLGAGMPEPVDYRDLPYIWQRGFFRMDEPLLRARLTTAELVLGDVADTLPRFLASTASPLGFISFDLDYYTSTTTALQALSHSPPDRYLPRTICYFDDTVGPHEELHSHFAGELLAIDEFNARHDSRKLAKIHGLAYKLWPLCDPWIEGMYVLHDFHHPGYNRYIFHERTRQFPLEQSGA
jgi:hypothetical protein